MKKLLLADGAGFFRFCAVLAALGTWLFLAPSSFAQTPHYDLTFVGLPDGNVDLTQYIGLDRKLKADVAGQYLQITVTPALTITKRVRLTITVSAQGSSVTQCNTQIATAVTSAFDLTGGGRNLGSAAFTGSSAIGVQSSTQNQPCIDALADKMTSGVASIPTGIYRIDAVLNDKPTPVTGEDARQAVLMALAARKSYDTNRPVRIAEVAG